MRKLKKTDIWTAVTTSPVYVRPSDRPQRFQNGDRVVIKNINPVGHTRLPRYVRGHAGVIQAHRGTFVFADSVAHGNGDQAQHLYNVRFEARELWGEDAPTTECVYLDLWDDYIKDTGE